MADDGWRGAAAADDTAAAAGAGAPRARGWRARPPLLRPWLLLLHGCCYSDPALLLTLA
jgi:hypothetical protein